MSQYPHHHHHPPPSSGRHSAGAAANPTRHYYHQHHLAPPSSGAESPATAAGGGPPSAHYATASLDRRRRVSGGPGGGPPHPPPIPHPGGATVRPGMSRTSPGPSIDRTMPLSPTMGGGGPASAPGSRTGTPQHGVPAATHRLIRPVPQRVGGGPAAMGVPRPFSPW